jgi:FtsZ-interacting cell division protein ZipA
LPSINPLFLALVIAGALLVLGVVLVNWLQERRVRRRVDAAFERPADEVRQEPVYRSESHADAAVAAATEGHGMPAVQVADDDDVEQETFPSSAGADVAPLTGMPGRAQSSGGVDPDPDIESIVLMRLHESATADRVRPLLSLPVAKPVRCVGRRAGGYVWQDVSAARDDASWQEIAACLLLANREGPASRADVDAFIQAATTVATSAGADAEAAVPDAEAARAEALDRFCADLDVQIGITLLKSGGGAIAGTRLRGVAEAAGFRLTGRGEFDYVDNDTGATLYALQNVRQEPFSAESMRVTNTPGVVFLLDVPRVAEPVRAFDHMRQSAKRMAHSLDAVLVDDNRRLLDDAALTAIRAQVQTTAEGLRAAHIEPGSTRALRLFG